MSQHSTTRQPGRPARQRTGQQPDPGAHPLTGPRPAEYVIVTWVSEQLRDRIHRDNAALAQELGDLARRRHVRKAEPQAELEAEP
jgi:hypothetical protein